MSFRESIENEDIRGLPPLEFNGKILVIENQKDQERAAEYLQRFDVLGFDTESKPSFKKGVIHPVSLLQLASEDRAYLIRLRHKKISDPLKEILESEGIRKVGVAIDDDIKDLRKIRPFRPGGFVPLEHFVKQAGIQNNGLRKLAAIALNGRISKSAQVSNWEAKQLSMKQKIYAATDAWAGLMIYRQLTDRGYNDHP